MTDKKSPKTRNSNATGGGAHRRAVHGSAEENSVQLLRDKHRGETAWIVGKGPSLAMLTKDQIGNGPVIAINDAVIALEAIGLNNPIYSLQKDADEYDDTPDLVPRIDDNPSFVPIARASLLVHRLESPHRMRTYSPRYVFDNIRDFGLEWFEFSSIVAAAIAKLMGCANVVYVAHDASVSGDARTCIPKPNGGYVVHPAGTETAVEYPQHRERIESYLAIVSMPVEWITPVQRDTPRFGGQLLIQTLTRDVERLKDEARLRTEEIERLVALLESTRRDVEQASLRQAQDQLETRSLRETLEQRRDALETLRSALALAENTIGHLSASLQTASAGLEAASSHATLVSAERDALATSLRASITDRDTLARGLETTAAERNALASSLEATIAERDTLARGLEATSSERDVLVSQLMTVVAERDGVARRVEDVTHERDTARHRVDELLNSASWRWMAPLRVVKRVLFRLKS